MTNGSPPLTRSDAWLIAALCESGPKPLRLDALIGNADWLDRAIPTYDELSFGLRRLVATGFVEVTRAMDGLVVQPTERSIDHAGSTILIGVVPASLQTRVEARVGQVLGVDPCLTGTGTRR